MSKNDVELVENWTEDSSILVMSELSMDMKLFTTTAMKWTTSVELRRMMNDLR